MSQISMYHAKINSPVTNLSTGIDSDDTTISVIDVSVFPTAPNLATLGEDEDAETVLYTEISGSDLTVTRGVEGTAKSWVSGTKIGRMFTAYDHDTFKTNIEDLNTNLDSYPFKIKSAFYNDIEDELSIIISSGSGETFNSNTIVNITKTTDTTFTISTPSASTTYTIYLKNDGNFASSTDGTTSTGSITIGTISTNADKTVNTIVDKRPLVSGVGNELIKHKIDEATLNQLGHIYHTTLTTTLDTTWTGTEAPYSKTQTVTGIVANDNPIIDVVMSGNFEVDKEQVNEWSKIYRITTSDNSITLYATDKPTVSLPIQLKVVR